MAAVANRVSDRAALQLQLAEAREAQEKMKDALMAFQIAMEDIGVPEDIIGVSTDQLSKMEHYVKALQDSLAIQDDREFAEGAGEAEEAWAKADTPAAARDRALASRVQEASDTVLITDRMLALQVQNAPEEEWMEVGDNFEVKVADFVMGELNLGNSGEQRRNKPRRRRGPRRKPKAKQAELLHPVIQEKVIIEPPVAIPDTPIKEVEKVAVDRGKRVAKGPHVHAKQDCPVCFCEVDQKDCISLELKSTGQGGSSGAGTSRPLCGHSMCGSCAQHLVKCSVERKSLEFCCPSDGCKGFISVDSAAELLQGTDTRETLAKLELLRAESFVRNPVYCPNPRCSELLEGPGEKEPGYPNAQCVRCRLVFCVKCKVNHDGMTCEQFARIPAHLRESSEDLKLLELMKNGQLRKCPKCGHLVEKGKDNCNFIKCRCGQAFCFRCGKAYQHERPTIQNVHGQASCGCWLFQQSGSTGIEGVVKEVANEQADCGEMGQMTGREQHAEPSFGLPPLGVPPLPFPAPPPWLGNAPVVDGAPFPHWGAPGTATPGEQPPSGEAPWWSAQLQFPPGEHFGVFPPPPDAHKVDENGDPAWYSRYVRPHVQGEQGQDPWWYTAFVKPHVGRKGAGAEEQGGPSKGGT